MGGFSPTLLLQVEWDQLKKLSYLHLVEAIEERKRKNHTRARSPRLAGPDGANGHDMRVNGPARAGYVSSRLCTGRGRIRFLGSTVATARWTSSSHYTRCSPISIDGLLFFFFFFLHADNPTVRMSILSLLFGFISFLLLALDPVNLIQIVVLVSIHISVIHIVSLFLAVRINLCIAKLLLFPTLCSYSEWICMFILFGSVRLWIMPGWKYMSCSTFNKLFIKLNSIIFGQAYV